MKILFLSSIEPNFNHFKAGSTVLANLLKESVENKHETQLYILANDEKEKINYNFYLKDKILIKKFSFLKLNILLKIIRLLLILIFKKEIKYLLNLKKIKLISSKIKHEKFDLIILFWDTEFEYLLPYLKNEKIMTYAALPRYYSSIKRVESLINLSKKKFITNIFKKIYYKNEISMHFKRIKEIKLQTNICDQTKLLYQKKFIKCYYVPNCWPDYFKKSQKIKIKKNNKINILANIGGLDATGNYYGIKYLINEIVPLLDKIKKHNYIFNLYGRYTLPHEFSLINKYDYIKNNGFVNNIEKEIKKNLIFLVLNNAYKESLIAGYTRVLFFFSFKKCVIAHTNLRKSMPELVHGQNCLLGNNKIEILKLINKAAKSPMLRKKIGNNARKTYLKYYTPEKVFSKILEKSSYCIE
jgi:hypothetical protein